MDIVIHPGRLRGTVRIPASKSAAHRAVLCAALAQGSSRLSPVQPTADIEATIGAAAALGAGAQYAGDVLTVNGIAAPPGKASIDCNESGSTLRFFVPIAAALGVEARFFGRGQLPHRPMSSLTDVLCKHGADVRKQGDEILTISGKLRHGRYEIAGDVSSQYITGLLFALPLLEGDSELILTSPLQSKGYVDMTVQMLARFGVSVQAVQDAYHIPGGQRYVVCGCGVEGDYSGAAFWLCAGALGADVAVTGLAPDSLQGDGQIVDIVRQFGAQVQVQDDTVHVTRGDLQAIDLDVSQIPDLVPIVAATAAFANGVTTIYNAARLRIKESDRLQSVTAGLLRMGADIVEHPDKLVITGKCSLRGGCTVDSFADHRIAMAMSIAALGCEEPVTITGAQCVDKSYPAFYRDFADLGGRCHVV